MEHLVTESTTGKSPTIPGAADEHIFIKNKMQTESTSPSVRMHQLEFLYRKGMLPSYSLAAMLSFHI